MAEKRNIKVRGGSIRKAAFIDIAQEQATTKVDLRDLERIQRELVIEWREELLYYKQEGERLSDLILEPCTLSIMKLMRGAATGNQDLSEESLSELIYALRGATIELAAALMKGEQQTSGLYQAMEESTGYDEWAETALQLVSIVQQLQEIESQIEKILTELNHHSKDWQRRLARDSRAIDDAIIFLAESEQCFNLVANDYIGGRISGCN